MAPPQFPMYSPKGPGGDDTPPGSPVLGAGRSDDPGFLASLRSPTVLGQLRRMAVVLMIAPVLILAISPLIVQRGDDRFDGAGPWIYLPLVAAALLAGVVGPRLPRPMEPEDEPHAAAQAALLQFRQAVLQRFALAEGVILLGLPLAIVGNSALIFAFGFVLGYPLLIMLVLPTAGTVERIRRRLEARGAESHLWAALLAPAPKPAS